MRRLPSLQALHALHPLRHALPRRRRRRRPGRGRRRRVRRRARVRRRRRDQGAPGDGKTWPPLEGGAAELTGGARAFAEGLVFDADGDGKPDLIAWSRAPDGLRGEVWFAPGKAPAGGRILAALPGDLAAPGCTLRASLTRIGPSAVAFDFDPRCPTRALSPIRATRWIAVFRLGAAPELGLEIRLGAPADGESLSVALDGRDRDGDGRGDLTATLTLDGAPRPLPAGGQAKATLAFFDRPAGLSRDPSEPEASLKTLTLALVADGRKKTTAPHLPAAAAAARRLWTLLCEEAGKPLVTTSAGPVHCPDVHLLEDAAIAETEAAPQPRRPLAAAAAMSRLDASTAKTSTPSSQKSVPSLPGRLVRTTAAAPDLTPPPPSPPRSSTTAATSSSAPATVSSGVDRTSFEGEGPPSDAALGRPTRLPPPSHPRDAPPHLDPHLHRRALRTPPPSSRTSEVGHDPLDSPLPILTPTHCTPGRVPADLLGPTAPGDHIAVRGDLIVLPRESPPHPALAETLALAPSTPVPLGAARSPDGSVLAVSTTRGVLVAQIKAQGRSVAAKLWTAPALDNATACVPNDAADRIACAVKGAAAIYDAK